MLRQTLPQVLCLFAVLLATLTLSGQSLEELDQQFNEARQLRRGGESDEAALMYKELMPKYEKLSAWEQFYECWRELAIVRSQKDDAKGVVEVSNEALHHCKRTIGTANISYARLLRYKGMGHMLLDNKDSALFLVHKSIDIIKEVSGEQDPLLITHLNSLTSIHRRFWENEEAMKYNIQARDLSILIEGGYGAKAARIDHSIGRIYNDGGQLGKAEQHLRKAYDYYISQGDTTSRAFGLMYADIGSVYRRKGWYNMALEYYFKAIGVMEKIRGPEHAIVLNNYRLVSYVYALMGDKDHAWQYINKAVEINRKNYGDEHYETLNALIAKALVAQTLEDHEQCISISKYLIGVFEGGKMQNYLGLVCQYLSESQVALEQYNAALTTLEQSLQYCNSAFGFDNSCTARTYSYMANVYSLLGEYEKSENYYAQAMGDGTKNVLQDTSGSYPFIEYFEWSIGRITNGYRSWLENPNDEMMDQTLAYGKVLRESVSAYSKAINQHNYEDFLSVNYKFSELLLNIYADLLKQEPSGDHLEVVNNTMESNRAFLLLGNMQSTEKYSYEGIPDSLLEKEQRLKASLEEARDRGDNQRMFTYSNELNQLIEQFKSYPDYYDLKYNVGRVPIKTIKTELINSNEVFVHYFQADTTLFGLVISKEETSLFTIPFSSSDEADLRKLHELISKKSGKDLEPLVAKLSEKYVTPLEHFIAAINGSVTGIHLVKDGLLSYLPFGLFKTSDDQFLIEKYAISEHLSATFWHRQNRMESTPSDVLGIAPTFASATIRTDESYPEAIRGSLGELPGATQEVSEIRELFSSSVLLGDEASESNVLNEINDYGIIHFATHAIADNENPEYSKLVLVGDSLEDGYLHSYELYKLKLNAQLVTLSACNTGFGKLQKGEGVMSLSRAFAYAGSPNTVMSLWPVSDKSTAELMTYFYQNLRDGMRKDQALRQAKLSYLQTANSAKANPYYWAGFVFSGDPAPIRFKSESHFLLWLLAGLVMVGVIIGTRRKRRS